MSLGSSGKVGQETGSHEIKEGASQEVSKCGRYSCNCNSKKIAGLVALVAAAVAIIAAAVIVSGIFGAGQMFFIAGGLAIVGMLSIALSAYLLTSDEDQDAQVKSCCKFSLGDIMPKPKEQIVE